MRILIVSRNLPRRKGYGIQMRLYKHIECFRGFSEVRLLMLQSNDDEFDLIADEQVFSGIQNQSRRAGLALFSMPEKGATPMLEELEFVERQLLDWSPDVAFFFRLDAARILESPKIAQLLKKVRKVFDLDDIESKAERRGVKANRQYYGRLISLRKLLDSIKLGFVERRAFANFDDVLVCSEADKSELGRKFGSRCAFRVVPNTIDIGNALPSDGNFAGPVNLLFVATLGYLPNARAIEYFVEEIYPLAKRLVSRELHLYIVGHNPPEHLLKLNDRSDITVTGSVDSVTPYYELSHIVICPLLSGGGTRIKIIEAMAFNRPIVSTTLGAEGLGVASEANILLADTPKAFSEAIVRLVEDPNLRRSIAASGLALAQQQYSTENLAKIYQALLASESGAAN